MCLRIQNIFIQTDQIWFREYQVKVLESLRQPERLHSVRLGRIWHSTIVEGGMCYVCLRTADDVVEHFPCPVLQRTISGDSIQNEYGFDGFGTVICQQFLLFWIFSTYRNMYRASSAFMIPYGKPRDLRFISALSRSTVP